MIYISTSSKNHSEKYIVLMPHEINNQFLGDLAILSQDKKIPYNFNLLGVSDFGDVIIPYEKLDDYLLQLETLINNLDDVIKYHPLPNTIWGFDERMFDNFVSNVDPDENNEVEVSSEGIIFSKEGMLNFLFKLREKAIEAKTERESLRFLGD